MDVLVVTALQEELDAVLDVAPDGREAWEQKSDRQELPYHVRELPRPHGRPLVVAAATCGVGETAVASRAATLVAEVDPAFIAMCGICAGRRGAVHLGDIIVAERVYSYDHGKLVAHAEGHEGGVGFYHDLTTYNLGASLRSKMVDFSRSFCFPEDRPRSRQGQRAWLLRAALEHELDRSAAPFKHPERRAQCPDWSEVVRALLAEGLVENRAGALTLTDKGRAWAEEDRLVHPDGPREEPPPQVHIGPIATGKTVRQDRELFDRLDRLVRKTLGVEMEAAAVGFAAELTDRRALVVKAVSDHADADKDDHFHAFACRASAHFLLSFLSQRLDPNALRGAPRDEPRYEDEANQRLAEQLTEAIERKERLVQVGDPIDEIDREILSLKREMREGGALRPGDELGDRYVLLERLGDGGFATVWRARDRRHPTHVALKVLHPHLAGDNLRRQRFLRGARAMADLSHPAIVRVLDPHGEDGRYHYFTMDLLTGGDLHRAVLQGGFPRERSIDLVVRVAEALSCAHESELVHRDVKPSNILLDAANEPFLADFDLVTAPGTTGGTRTAALGSAVYAAPELIERPQHADVRADVYGLAMTAVFALHGKEISGSILRDLNGFFGALPCNPRIREILRRAVEYEPAQRFPDVSTFRAALAEAASPRDNSVAASHAGAGHRSTAGWAQYGLRRAEGLILEKRPRPEDFGQGEANDRSTVARRAQQMWSEAGVLTDAARDLFLLAKAEGRKGVGAIAVALDETAQPTAASPGSVPEGTVLVVMEQEGTASGWDVWIDARDAFWATHGERVGRALEAEAQAPLHVATIDAERFAERTRQLLGRFGDARARFASAGPFVEPRARVGGEARAALAALDDWLASPARAALVVGPCGSGKSTLLSAFCRGLAERQGAPWPVLVPLAGPRGAAAGEFESHLLAAAGVARGPGNDAALELLVRRRLLLPVFDGLGEQPLGAGETLAGRLRRLSRVAGGEGRVIVSVRERDIPDLELPVEGAADELHRVDLEPLDEARSLAVLELALGKAGAHAAWTRIAADPAFSALVQRPALLAEAIAVLEGPDAGAPLAAEGVYAAYFERWIERTSTWVRGAFSQASRRAFAEALAAALFSTGHASCTWSELGEAARRRLAGVGLGGLSGEEALEEIRDGALLERNAEERYSFAHAVVQDFFLVRYLIAWLTSHPAEALASRPLPPGVIRLLGAALSRQPEVEGAVVRAAESLLQGAVTADTAASAEEIAEARANALRILLGLAREAGAPGGRLPEGADLRGARLAGESLAGVRLVRAQLSGADLSGADLGDADLRGADLSGARLSAARLDGAVLRDARLRGADLTYVAADGCDLTGADLTGAVLRQSVWTRCRFDAATLSGVDVTACILPLPEATVSPRGLEATIGCGPVGGVRSLAWDRAGARLACGDSNGKILLFEGTTGALLGRLAGHERTIDAAPGIVTLAWDPAGAELASVGSDGTIRTWDTALSREKLLVQRLEPDERGSYGRSEIRGLAWHPTAPQIATGEREGVRIWDASSGDELVRLHRAPRDVFWWTADRIAWHPSGKRLLIGEHDGSLRVVDIVSGETSMQAKKLEEVSSQASSAVAWLDRKAVQALGDEQGKVWIRAFDEHGKAGAATVIPAHAGKVKALSFGGRRVASGGEDASACLWEMETARPIVRLSGHRGYVDAVAVDDHGDRMASGDTWGNVCTWNARYRREGSRVGGTAAAASALAWDPGGKYLAIAHYDGSIHVWEGATGRALAHSMSHTGFVTGIAWDWRGTHLASASGDGTVRVWDAPRLVEIAELKHAQQARVFGVAWDPAGRRVASCTSAGPVVWDVVSRRDRHLIQSAHEREVFHFLSPHACHAVAWDPSGQRIAGAMAAGPVLVWDVDTGEELAKLEGHKVTIAFGTEATAWDREGKRLASGGADCTVRLWDVASARELHRCEGHRLAVLGVVWAPDGGRVASCSWDGTVRVWDAASGAELACLEGHLGPVNAVHWEPSGRRLASASEDGTVRIWDGSTYRLLCTLEAAGLRSLARTPGGYCLFEERDREGPGFCLSARRPERPGSALYLPLGGLREVLHRPDKVEAALRSDLTGDGELEQDLAAFGLSGGIRWDGERRVLP